MEGMVPVLLSWMIALGWGVGTPDGASAAVACVNPEPPEYYAFEMVTTKNVPGTARLTGTAAVTFAPSPFGVSVSPDGSYALDVHLSFENLREAPGGGVWAVWLTKSDLSEISYAGELTPGEAFAGRASWNKFLAIVTLEDPAHVSGDEPPARWAGPVVTRGMSRSGMMHTMAGHGPFQEENCAAYGYGG
ncbi:MAG: hypothetical protein KJP18_11620 [Gemmatimonadetes bacterium]|nr:hypothetical protein [Gemmatimonadota bacterium]